MAAIGEHWRDIARSVDNFVFVALGTGIGWGVFVDGRLYRGRTGSAGGIRRMNIEWLRWNEDFGDADYFESYASGQGIAAEGRKMLGRGLRVSPEGLPKNAMRCLSSIPGDGVVRKPRPCWKRSSPCWEWGIANVVAVIDPGLLVLRGAISKGAPEMLLAAVNGVVARIQPDPPPIRASSVEDKAQTYGAVSLALTAGQEEIAPRFH